MNREILAGNYRQLKGLVLQQWGRITDDDFRVLEGRQEYWAGEMMEARGMALADSRRLSSNLRARLPAVR